MSSRALALILPNSVQLVYRILALAALCFVWGCRMQPANAPTLIPINATSASASASPTSAPTTSLPAAPVIDKSQLLPSGLRIEEHPLVRRPEIEPLILLALDGQTEVQLLRKHASLLRESLRPESYYSVSAGSLWVMHGNDRLEAVESGCAEASATVTRNGQDFFSVPNRSPGVTSPFRALAVYDDHWVLELAQRVENPDSTIYFPGQIFIDGNSINDQYGYQESFGFQTIAGRPFYFFKRADKIGIVYDGGAMALEYDGVPHYGCCSAGALNPRIARNMLAFYAWRGDRWYYVEIGAFEEGR